MTVQLIRGSHALVSSGHHVASFEAAAVLRDGGNVVDAAIAGAAVLAVVLPYACGLGGDLFLLHHDAATGTLHGLNATGAAPRAATPDRFAAAMPDEGALSITVPAMVAGWAAAADRFASRPLGALLAPAVRLAEHGFPVHAALSRNAATKAALLRRDEAACALFLPGDRPPAEGAHFRQPDAAATLARIAAEGPDGFYRGPVAARIAAAVAAAGGLLTADDLATASAQWQTPIRAPFAGFDVATMPPNSWGLTLLLQLLALEAGGIAATRGDDAAFFRSAIAARRAAYRAALPVVADPAAGEDAARAVLAAAIADPARLAAAPGAVADAAGGDTSVLVVMDAAGNAVSLIQSVSGPFGSGLVAPGTGVVLNNRMRGFSTDPASPNRVAPGRRPAHTLTPAMVYKDGRPFMTIATPGMAGQTCTLAQVLARVLARGEALDQAIAAPRWSVTPKGEPIVEATLAPAVRDALAAEERTLTTVGGSLTFGSIKAVAFERNGLVAVADHRRVAGAAGW